MAESCTKVDDAAAPAMPSLGISESLLLGAKWTTRVFVKRGVDEF